MKRFVGNCIRKIDAYICIIIIKYKPRIPNFRKSFLNAGTDLQCNQNFKSTNMDLQKKCVRLEKQLNKSQAQLKLYEDCKVASLNTQAKALDAIQREIITSTAPHLKELDRKLSECSIQHQQQIETKREIVDRFKMLNDKSTVMLAEMQIDFQRVRDMCEDIERKHKSNIFMVPTDCNTAVQQERNQNVTDCESVYMKLCSPSTSKCATKYDAPSSKQISASEKAYNPTVTSSPLLKEWNSETPSPIPSPRADNTFKTIARPTKTNIIGARSLSQERNASTMKATKSKVSFKSFEEWMGDIHRKHASREAEFHWVNYIFQFSNDDVYHAIIFLLEHQSIYTQSSYTAETIRTYLTPYLVDAVNELAANMANPNTFNTVCYKYEEAEDKMEEDYVRIDIFCVLPRLLDILLARAIPYQIGCLIQTIKHKDRINEVYVNTLYDLHLVLDGRQPGAPENMESAMRRQCAFKKLSMAHFARNLAKKSVPYNVYMATMIFICYAK